jgi:hypothetical protein
MGTEPATEARHKHHFTPEIQVAVAKARRRCGGLRTAGWARMVGEIPYGILRCEAEKRRLMLARVGG